MPDADHVPKALQAVAAIGEGDPHHDAETGRVTVGVGDRGSDALVNGVRALDAAQVKAAGLTLRRPSLDDVFLALTGHAAEDD